MDAKTLRSKSASALTKELGDTFAKLKELRFKLSSNQLKSVREVRVLKRQIARIKTILVQMEGDVESASKTE
ncbi:50S ribosomal protein L29 [Candidatus Uhrbacteria bacterium]|nr:50S ribosomal protein L29 [Candidatus Uhrbacteria bacterium]